MSRRAALAMAVGLTALIGLGDQVTGADIAFTLLYAAPIALATWYAGIRGGTWMSVFATLCSIGNALLDHRSWIATTWNEVGILLLFLALTYLLHRHHEHLARERAQHRLTVDQLRHADRLNVIGTLAAGVAHEIGTPLNVISGSAELIAHAKTPAERDQMVLAIREQTERISAIIRHLLDFGRRAGQKTTSVELGDLARSAVALVAPIARKKQVSIVVEPATERVVVDGNSAELEQVLCNLILNGVQAMSGRGTITVRTGTSGTISVEDEGPGIDPEVLPHIFEPFFTTKGVGEGTGLGLSVSYGIVTDHGGTIEAESTRRGARFIVHLPLAGMGELLPFAHDSGNGRRVANGAVG
ncbi:MAG: sensor histidine kinase [Kofleriaceae bacterium]